MPASRPIPNIRTGCHELRIIDEKATWRIVYYVDHDAIVVLEVFEKRTPTTPSGVVENCKRRLRSYENTA